MNVSAIDISASEVSKLPKVRAGGSLVRLDVLPPSPALSRPLIGLIAIAPAVNAPTPITAARKFE
jgi:hypothetical protein